MGYFEEKKSKQSVHFSAASQLHVYLLYKKIKSYKYKCKREGESWGIGKSHYFISSWKVRRW